MYSGFRHSSDLHWQQQVDHGMVAQWPVACFPSGSALPSLSVNEFLGDTKAHSRYTKGGTPRLARFRWASCMRWAPSRCAVWVACLPALPTPLAGRASAARGGASRCGFEVGICQGAGTLLAGQTHPTLTWA